MRKFTVALIGNPNTGKTTLFNQLTGARQRVGNWAGVTVERKEGQFFTSSSDIQLIDLPGIRSLTTFDAQASIDESIACQYLFSDQASLIINVVDATNLENNLFLTLQLLELGVPCIVALNMQDIAQRQNISVNAETLSRLLGCPVVRLTSTRGEGIGQLKNVIDQPQRIKLQKRVNLPDDVENAISQLCSLMPFGMAPQKKYWLSMLLLEGDINSQKMCSGIMPPLQKVIERLGGDPAMTIISLRYRAIADICELARKSHSESICRLTEKIDKIVLNRWAGIPLFFAIMYLMFFISINIGAALQPIFDAGSVALFIHGMQWIGYYYSLPAWITMFLAQGIGAGINTVLPILPQIGLMYLILSFLEDSGYMARAGFIMDRLMQYLGLPGKSFVPLIVGFGCNVPSVMGARTLDTPRERLITILISPFMSCGARLAIFAVFAAAFFNEHSAILVFSLYILGIVTAIITGVILKCTLLRGQTTPFIMEMPVYHCPHLKSLFMQTWQRLKMFILRAGRVIILVGLIIGIASSVNLNGKIVDDINYSLLASASRAITPALQPIGVTSDNWQATVGLIAGIMAKEVVVGTLNSLYTGEVIQSGEFNPQTYSLTHELAIALKDTWNGLSVTLTIDSLSNPISAGKGDGDMASHQIGVMSEKFGTRTAAYSYLMFVLLYVPCVSVMGAITREAGRNWMLFSFFWGLNVAYSMATLFYQSINFGRHPGFSATCLSVDLIINILFIACLHRIGQANKNNRFLPLPRPKGPAVTCDHCSTACGKKAS